MIKIRTVTEKERVRLEFEIDVCLRILYMLEDKLNLEVISDCIDTLQRIEVCSIAEDIKDIMKEVE